MSELPSPKLRPASSWSVIWVLPVIALLIGAWLGWQAYRQAGIKVEVFFETGTGIQVGKTEVMYKGMPIGKVVDMTLDDTGIRRGVHVTLEMDQSFRQYLRTSTRFWLVKPSVTLGGISGLDTLLSGNYIGVSPGGDGEAATRFIALSDAPPLSEDMPGLHLTLQAERLGSINRDSPVFYRQIQVGRVKNYELGADKKSVDVQIFIEPAYAGLVRRHTRFWNASGLTINAGLSGVKVSSESLVSLLAGGIAFATPEHKEDSPEASKEQKFKLYDDFDSAQAGIKIEIELPEFDGITAGSTPIMLQGLQVGVVKALKVKPDLSGATAEVAMDPLTEDYLVSDTEFWVVKPSISLAGISGLEALVKGNYLAMRPGELGKAAQREFGVRNTPPPLDLKAPGLHLVLFSDNLNSLAVGSPILYRQIKVGSVQSYQLRRNNQGVALGVHIEPEYAHLVNSSTRFWSASGLKISGGLSGVDIQSESLQSLIAGGVAFDTPDMNAATVKERVPMFSLFSDRDTAFRQGTTIRVQVPTAEGLTVGTPLRYKGLQVGQVEKISLAKDLQSVWLEVLVTEQRQRIAAKGALFWVVGPELGLMRTANLETLITGQYLQVEPAPVGAPSAEQFKVLASAPELATEEAGLPLVLSAPRRGSIKAGVPITYREITVGKVTGYELGRNADQVLIHILIEPRYAPLVRSGSRFWNTSGFGFDFGLIKGITLRTESVETIMEGGIAFATPAGDEMGRPALPGQTFPMYAEYRDEWLNWAPKIALPAH